VKHGQRRIVLGDDHHGERLQLRAIGSAANLFERFARGRYGKACVQIDHSSNLEARDHIVKKALRVADSFNEQLALRLSSAI
jgi:hypothetical protein